MSFIKVNKINFNKKIYNYYLNSYSKKDLNCYLIGEEEKNKIEGKAIIINLGNGVKEKFFISNVKAIKDNNGDIWINEKYIDF